MDAVYWKSGKRVGMQLVITPRDTSIRDQRLGLKMVSRCVRTCRCIQDVMSSQEKSGSANSKSMINLAKLPMIKL